MDEHFFRPDVVTPIITGFRDFDASTHNLTVASTVNLSEQKQRATVTLAPELTSKSGKRLMDQEVIKIANGRFSMDLSSCEMQVLNWIDFHISSLLG